jgi:hypothetical protein
LPSKISFIKLSEKEIDKIKILNSQYYVKNSDMGSKKEVRKVIYYRFPLSIKKQFLIQYNTGIITQVIFINNSHFSYIPYTLFERVIKYPITHFDKEVKYYNIHIETKDARIIEIDGRYHDIHKIFKNIKKNTENTHITLIQSEKSITWGKLSG